MHSATFLQDLAVVMIVAGGVTVLFQRLRQPVVLGYILAGMIIGPHTPPFPLVKDPETIRTLADLGVVFLMFSLGLEFSLRKLRSTGAAAATTASLEIAVMLSAGYGLGRLFGWSRMDALFLGALLSISSTTIIVKALRDLGKTKDPSTDLVFGILVVEDLLAIVMIALLSGIAMTGSPRADDLFRTAGRLGVFLVVSVVLGLLLIPRLLAYLSRFKSDETLLIAALALCFGTSLLALRLGYSPALGAFIVGAVVAESREIGKIAALTAPIRDLFSAVFFVAVGLLIQPRMMAEHAGPIAAVALTVVAGKVLACSLGAIIAGQGIRTSLQVGMSLAQIGEFSFIIAGLGLKLGVTGSFLYPIAVTVSAITTLLTPYLIRGSGAAADAFYRIAPGGAIRYLDLYGGWVSRLGKHQPDGVVRRHLRRVAIQMALNLFLIAAAFLGMAALGRKNPLWMPRLPEALGGVRATAWLAAALISLPLYVASARKLLAVGMLISELSVPLSSPAPHAAGTRALIAHTILAAGLGALALFTFLLSAALLPTWKALAALLGIVAVTAAFLWSAFVKLYASAQVTLTEVLAQKPPVPEPEPAPLLPRLLRDAEMQSVRIPSGSAAAGKLIRELELRTRTGASAVGIERGGTDIVNPGPDEEIQAGDTLLLLGTPDQLCAARVLLTGRESEDTVSAQK